MLENAGNEETIEELLLSDDDTSQDFLTKLEHMIVNKIDTLSKITIF
jgi:hypothetical protein